MKSESVLSELHLANETNVPKELFFYWFYMHSKFKNDEANPSMILLYL